MSDQPKPWAQCYQTVTSRLVAAEQHHDAIEQAAFAAADAELVALLDACPADRADEVRAARLALLVLHSRWRIRRTGLVADNDDMLAAACEVLP